MSENLKRAESLFNRIMNQNSPGPVKPEPRPGHRFHGNEASEPHHGAHRAKNPNRKSLVPVDVPQKDPVKIAQDTVLHIPSHHHILPYCWTIWHHYRLRKPAPVGVDEEVTVAVGMDLYLQTTNEIEFGDLADPSHRSVSIGSLEQFWYSISQIKQAHHLAIGRELLIFKSGINPVWEDPINTKGGRWVFRFVRRALPNDLASSTQKIRERTSLIWERLVLKIVSGSIIPQGNYLDEIQDVLLNDISGVVLSVRKDEDIISVWNSNLSFSKKKDDGSKKVLTSFQARRIICDAILRVIRECDLIVNGADIVSTLDNGSNKRVQGVSFEYRLHADVGSQPPASNGRRLRREEKEW